MKSTKILYGLIGFILLLGSFGLGRISKDYIILAKKNKTSIQSQNTQSQIITSPNKSNTSNKKNATGIPTGTTPEKAFEDTRIYSSPIMPAPDGYVGGRVFSNRERILPPGVSYQEWDVNPKIEGKNRGAERLVTSEKEAYYTADHYKTFIKIDN